MSSRPRSRIVAALVIVGSIASVATSKKAIRGEATLPPISLDAEHPTATFRVRAELRDARRVPNPRLTATFEQRQEGRAASVRAGIVRDADGDIRVQDISADARLIIAGSIWSDCQPETTCVDEVLVEIELVDRTVPIELSGTLEAEVPHGEKGSIRLDVARVP